MSYDNSKNFKDDFTITGSGGIDTITLDLGSYNSDTLTITNSANMSDTITIPSNYSLSGDSGSVYTSYNWNSISSSSTVKIDTEGIDMQPGTDIKIGGKSLMDSIEKIEERLGILNPNPELEERWEQLKELRKQYVELEKDILEKEKIMKILKEQ